MSDGELGSNDILRKVEELTHHILYIHYHNNDVEQLISYIEDPFTWFGTGEEEHGIGADYVASIFRQFEGMVIKCNLSDGEYHAAEIAPHTYVCVGRVWIETDPSTNAVIRVHQRVVMIFRERDGELKCCHISISNPYTEMVQGDVGFPTQVGTHTYEYLQERIREQEQKLEEQTAELRSIYNSTPCAIMRFLKTDSGYEFLSANHAAADMIGVSDKRLKELNWSEGFCMSLADEDIPRMRAALETLNSPGDRVDVTCRLRRPFFGDIHVNSINFIASVRPEGLVLQKIVFDISERVNMEEALRQKSFEDPLTGLFNRTKFNERLHDGKYSEVSRLGVAYFDLNGLKATNDQFGHAAGDSLIRRTARHIDSRFPGRTYRIGGDEYVVIEPEIDRDEFEESIERICQAMEADDISTAVGISWREADCDVEKQFDEADTLMYKDKAEYYSRKAHDRRRN